MLKRFAITSAAAFLLASLYFAAAHFSGGAFPTLGLPIGGTCGQLRRTALSFMEDIQFKDFEKAASYHDPKARQSVDIPFLLRRLFQVKPEALDLMDFEVVFCKVDSSGDRARVKMRVKAKLLANGAIRDQELMLFFRRTDGEEGWYMELEDSLREDSADPNKRS